MTQATTFQTLIQGTSQVQNVGSPKSYKRASRINTSLFSTTITHSNRSTRLASQLYRNISSLHTPLAQPQPSRRHFSRRTPPPFLIKVTPYAPWGPHSPFALQTSGIPNQVVWAINSGCTKPRARILATEALRVPNHVPTLNQLAVKSFHKRTP